MASPSHFDLGSAPVLIHSILQASSLSPACNAPKQSFDTCFNHWFKSYLLLVSPPLLSPSHTPQGLAERTKRDRLINEKKAQYEKDCGAFYASYQKCLKTEIAGKEGLKDMLEAARREEPLEGWDGIRVATDAE